MPPSSPISPLVILSGKGQLVGAREEQEDACLVVPAEDNAHTSEQFLGILADGMGAHADGAAASREVLGSCVSACLSNGGDLMQALREANHSLAECKQAGLIGADAGSTLIALSLKGGQCSWLSVGDSLLYLFREGKLRALNEKHSLGELLAKQVQQGLISEDEAQGAGSPHALYSAVCGDEIAAIDYRPHELVYRRGDRFLIASDGLAPLLPSLESTLQRPEVQGMPAAAACEHLLHMVEEKHAPRQDNTSLIIADVCDKGEVFTRVTPPHGLQEACVTLQGDRSSQQDACGIRKGERNLLAVVADGAGGHAGGAEAARIAVDILFSLWQERLCHGCDTNEAAELLNRALLDAHHSIIEKGGGNPAQCGKCAIVVLYAAGRSYAVLHAGDCRLYQGNSEGWQCRTEDDSMLQMLLNAGRITPEETRNHPDQSMLTQALGATSEPQPHVHFGHLPPGDSLLLCCDGFWNQLSEKLWRPRFWHTRPHKRADRLQQLAEEAGRAAGGDSDNITAIWLHPAEAESMGKRMSTGVRLLLCLLIVLLLPPLLYLGYRSLAPLFCTETPAPHFPLPSHHG